MRSSTSMAVVNCECGDTGSSLTGFILKSDKGVVAVLVVVELVALISAAAAAAVSFVLCCSFMINLFASQPLCSSIGSLLTCACCCCCCCISFLDLYISMLVLFGVVVAAVVVIVAVAAADVDDDADCSSLLNVDDNCLLNLDDEPNLGTVKSKSANVVNSFIVAEDEEESARLPFVRLKDRLRIERK